METIGDQRVRFGELSGRLVHGGTLFDWQLVSTQEFAEAYGYSFEEILADDGIPYAPVVVQTSVDRYPRTGDAITVETVPISAGDTSVELCYEVTDESGDSLMTTRIVHVTIDDEGTALELPDAVREAFIDDCVDRDPVVGPEDEPAGEESDVSFASSFDVRSPYIEGAELAYFENYPNFATIAIEHHLEANDTSLPELRGEKHPYRIRDWQWQFKSPVLFGTTLEVECDVETVSEDTIRVAQEFSTDGRTNIEAVSEYGCFDADGKPAPYDDEMLEPFL
ncbi:acyl-CoA thioesterase [Natrarchaeobaculum aegyptiacum]|uniref:Thioesterase n=1 Tax=Natrarchaeobaculum aegyptiacum TaxID=745377 RepID=A0A2Z2I174_9EURY|nr:acyl-[acyl-carrier-protein] thioesterase [Natrarchaeobaculum aegyptiacum]ARS90118.1 thioesterase [Natrarchaeobaculum aegyptiacum]